MNDDLNEQAEPELTADEQALVNEMPALTDVGQTRRVFLEQTITGGLGLFTLTLLEHEKAFAAMTASPDAVFAAASAANDPVKVILKVNGVRRTLELDSRVVLLDALRERLELQAPRPAARIGMIQRSPR
jgi:xanthine dehydrogenase YagT iron-sulfur-binding subunit